MGKTRDERLNKSHVKLLNVINLTVKEIVIWQKTHAKLW